MFFSPDILFGLIGFLLTVFVLSYLIGDQVFFRVAVYVFVGASAGYVASIAWHQVLVPQLVQPLFSGRAEANLTVLFPALLVLFLFFKAFPSTSPLGTPSVAFMVGVGTAVAIGGAVTGTLIPQVLAAINTFDLAVTAQAGGSLFEKFFEAILMLFGTISTLVYFQFTARRMPDGTYKRNPIVRIIAWVGSWLIAITFGVLFAGIYSAALTALIERLSFIINFILGLLDKWLL